MQYFEINTAEIVYKARKSAGLTQKQLGELLSVRGTYLSQIEHGAKIPSLKLLQQICEVCKFSVKVTIENNSI